jgi:hypothetical protein
MNKSSFASSEKKVYRLNSLYRWYHFVIAAIFLVAAVLMRGVWFISIPIVLFAVFMVARPFTTAVVVDQYSVTLKRMFSGNSLLRSSITAIERVHTGRATLLRLWGDMEKKEQLSIAVNVFAFDEAWDDWLSTFRDLSSDKPLSLF